jgi:hypothetical protein
MSEVKINVVRKSAATSKLTISEDRVELKVRDNVSEAMAQWLELFAGAILRDVLAGPPVEQTLRGRFREMPGVGVYFDLTKGVSHKQVKRYLPAELGIHPAPCNL